MPIVPDEARTGMICLFKVAGIYSHEGQKYRPVDADSLLPYREASDGQILQEGICEVGAMASFMAAGSLCGAWPADDPVLYLLFRVRYAASGRYGLGLR